MSENYAKITDLTVNPALVLSPMVKQNLVKVIEQEFASQQTIYNAEADQKKEEILDQYRKGVGYDKLKKDFDKAVAEKTRAEDKVKELEKKIKLKGLHTSGTRYSNSHDWHLSDEENKELKMASEKLTNLLNTVEQHGPSRIKNKIISRLWIAETAGEAMVILREVLGNGIIPNITKKELITHKTEE